MDKSIIVIKEIQRSCVNCYYFLIDIDASLYPMTTLDIKCQKFNVSWYENLTPNIDDSEAVASPEGMLCKFWCTNR